MHLCDIQSGNKKKEYIIADLSRIRKVLSFSFSCFLHFT